MPQPKYVGLVIASCFVLAVLLGTNGCRKCYYCYVEGGQFLFYKGHDSIYSGGPGTLPGLVQQYKDSGYSCDTLSLGWGSGSIMYPNMQCTYGKESYKQAVAAGDSCVDEGYSNLGLI